MNQRPLRISFAPIAKADLIERAAFFAAEAGQEISDRFVESVAQTVDLLSRMPKIGRVFLTDPSGRHHELRRISLAGAFYRTTLLYTCDESELRVERLLHSAQDVQALFD